MSTKSTTHISNLVISNLSRKALTEIFNTVAHILVTASWYPLAKRQDESNE